MGLKGEGLPSPFDFGLEPVSPNTANWRGFIMTYIVVEKQLNVHEIKVTVKGTMRNPPVINEIKPKLEKKGLIHLIYNSLKLKTQFTGIILIAKDFIDSVYVHMGFQSPFSFETVIELEFGEGNLLSVRNLSSKMKEYRKRDLSNGKIKRSHDLQAWIARTFSLDYDL